MTLKEIKDLETCSECKIGKMLYPKKTIHFLTGYESECNLCHITKEVIETYGQEENK